MIEQPLRGWKEIAGFLGTSARSAQRWERELGLPVHRLRDTTGSVVSAYPSELDTWRKSVAADLRSEPKPGGAEDGRDSWVEDGTAAETKLVSSSDPAHSSARARPRVRAGWVVVAAAIFGGVAVAGSWLWFGVPARPQSAAAAGHVPGHVLRVTSGASTVRLRPGAGEMATVTLPGVPELQVRAIPAGSELTVEFHQASLAGAAAGGLARIASLRLTPGVPGELTLPGSLTVRVVWEDGSPPLR